MITTHKLIRLASRWHKMAAKGRKRISLTRTGKHVDAGRANKSSLADKGHFVFYTTDQRRYVMPLAYLSTNIFLELFRMSEEAFGLSSDGPITLPCDAVFMDYVVLLIHQGLDKDLEKALLNTTSHCSLSASFPQGPISQQSVVCGY